MSRSAPLLVVLTLALLTGCTTHINSHEARFAGNPITFDWAGSVDAGRTLEIRGVNGAIRVVPASGDRAVVQAVLTGRRSDPEEVRIEVVEHAGGVTVCAVYPSQVRANRCAPGSGARITSSNNDVSVRFQVQVPEGVRLVARTTNGGVDVESGADVVASTVNGTVRVSTPAGVQASSVNGAIDIRHAREGRASTTNGSITARLSGASGAEAMDFRTTNGSITLYLPPAASAMVDARVTNGRIVTDLPLTVVGRVGRRHLQGSLGSGGAPLTARTTNGSVRLRAHSP
jgi:hypothetical protein